MNWPPLAARSISRSARVPRAASWRLARLGLCLRLLRSEAENRLTDEQRRKRDEIEHAVLKHREKKGKIPDDAYYRDLEKMLLELARLYATNSASSNSSNASTQ